MNPPPYPTHRTAVTTGADDTTLMHIWVYRSNTPGLTQPANDTIRAILFGRYLAYLGNARTPNLTRLAAYGWTAQAALHAARRHARARYGTPRPVLVEPVGPVQPPTDQTATDRFL